MQTRIQLKIYPKNTSQVVLDLELWGKNSSNIIALCGTLRGYVNQISYSIGGSSDYSPWTILFEYFVWSQEHDSYPVEKME